MLGLIFLSFVLWVVCGKSNNRSWRDEKKRLWKEARERDRNHW